MSRTLRFGLVVGALVLTACGSTEGALLVQPPDSVRPSASAGRVVPTSPSDVDRCEREGQDAERRAEEAGAGRGEARRANDEARDSCEREDPGRRQTLAPPDPATYPCLNDDDLSAAQPGRPGHVYILAGCSGRPELPNPVYPLYRRVPDDIAVSGPEAVLRFAMESWLDGLTPAEEARRFGLPIPEGADTSGILGRVEVDEGVATIDVTASFEQLEGSYQFLANAELLLDAWSFMAFQFEEIEELVLLYEGSCGAFYERVAHGPCERRFGNGGGPS